MRLGIAGSLYYYTYKPFIEAFFESSPIEVCYSTQGSGEILEMGISHAVDEACLPVKMFRGHISKLAASCDYIVVPRIMKTEYGEAICPKIAGLPELARTGVPGGKLIFPEPVYLSRPDSLYHALKKDWLSLGLTRKQLRTAIKAGYQAQREADKGMDEEGYKYKVLLAGHSYNIHDSFTNMDLIKKLHRMDIGVITEEAIPRKLKAKNVDAAGLQKIPFRSHFYNLYGSAVQAAGSSRINGIIYVSSFSCGVDPFIVEMIRMHMGDMPMMVLKIDEQRGEAGYDTRLEAFGSLIERKSRMRGEAH